jgi:hypothetical protein
MYETMSVDSLPRGIAAPLMATVRCTLRSVRIPHIELIITSNLSLLIGI